MQDSVTQDRNKYLGGSDIPAVMGISPFATRWQLLQQKAGFEENTFHGSVYTAYGNVMEAKIRDYINEHFDMNFVEDKIILDDSDVLPARYHSDGHDKEKKATLEIKTTSQIASVKDALDKKIDFNDYEWQFYKKYYAQAFYGADLFRDEEVWLAVYERPDDLSEEFDPERLFVSTWKVNAHKEFTKEIRKEVDLFRQDFDFIKANPFATEAQIPSRSIVAQKAYQTITIGTTEVPKIWLLQNKKTITDALKAISAELLEGMEKANINSFTFDDLGVRVTKVAKGADTIADVFDEERFKAEHPDMWKEYQMQQVKKGKAASVRVTRMAEREKA